MFGTHTPTQTFPASGGASWEFEFANGYGASVACHAGSYGGPSGLYEVGVLDRDGRITISTPITTVGVVGWLDAGEVTEMLDRIAALNEDSTEPGAKPEPEPEPLSLRDQIYQAIDSTSDYATDRDLAEAVMGVLARLDGSKRAAVRLLTGHTDAELDALGGLSDCDSSTPCPPGQGCNNA